MPGAGTADVVLDCFGLMHAADQAAALAERAARVAPGGVLLLQYHSLGTILSHGQWNALRHGHYAYYSAAALAAMLAARGFTRAPRGPSTSTAAPCCSPRAGTPTARVCRTRSVRSTLAAESRGVRDPAAFGDLQREVRARADGLRDWLAASGPPGTRSWATEPLRGPSRCSARHKRTAVCSRR